MGLCAGDAIYGALRGLMEPSRSLLRVGYRDQVSPVSRRSKYRSSSGTIAATIFSVRSTTVDRGLRVAT